MPKVVYIAHPDHGSHEHVVDAPTGETVMEVAVKNAIPGIEAICGGSCACATCHVYVDAEWTERVGPPSDMESSMLELAIEVEPNSRLACQVRVTEALDGLIVRLPKSQQ